MTTEMAELEIGPENLKVLTGKKIVEIEGRGIIIKFLDEQYEDIAKTSKSRSNAANERWKKWKQKQCKPMQMHTSALQKGNGAMQTYADREIDREEKIDRYITTQEAFESISGNYKDMEAASKLLTNRGWINVDEAVLKSLLYHFVETVADINNTSDDVRKHFRNWLNKRELMELQDLSKSIKEQYGRSQRQKT